MTEKNKFVEKMKEDGAWEEFSDYIHLNFKMIMTKVLSESRRRLDINPELSREYTSLMYSILGRFFNEVVYSSCGYLSAANMKLDELLPESTIKILKELLDGKTVRPEEIDGFIERATGCEIQFEVYYKEHIDELRGNKECDPKW